MIYLNRNDPDLSYYTNIWEFLIWVIYVFTYIYGAIPSQSETELRGGWQESIPRPKIFAGVIVKVILLFYQDVKNPTFTQNTHSIA